MGAIRHIRNIALYAGMLLMAHAASSQIAREKLERRITVSKDQMRIDSLLDLFSKQTGIEFSFNSRKINPGKLIPVKKGGQTLAACLSQVQRNTGIHYAAIGNHIILIDNPPTATHALNLQAKPATPNPVKGPVKKELVNVQSTNRMENNAMKGNEEIDEKIRIRPSEPTWYVQNVSESPFVKAPETYVSSAVVVKGAISSRDTANAGTSNRISGSGKTGVGIPAGFAIGISISRPDVHPNITGIGGDIQYEKLFGRRFSATVSLGYNFFMGEYKDEPFTGDSSTKKNFANIPLMAGLRYYFIPHRTPVNGRRFAQGPYLSAELGEAIGGGPNSSHLSFTPAAGYKFPLGNSAIDLTIKFTHIAGGLGIPESTALKKGEYNIWSFRAAFVF